MLSMLKMLEALQVLKPSGFALIESRYSAIMAVLIILSVICVLRKRFRNERLGFRRTSTKEISHPELFKRSRKLLITETSPLSRWRAKAFLSLISLILLFGLTSWTPLNTCGSQLYPDLLEAGVEALVVGLESGAWTSVDLTKAYIRRIEETNDVLQAVTEINPSALTTAAALDLERASGTIRSALHGIPILIKNNIATKDCMNNTAGSFSLLGARVSHDATVISKLRSAGVILLGKSNLSQWANYRSTNSSNGWSAHGGQVTGAYFPNMDASGSSSGSGVASSIGLALAALGTETDGSITSPSSTNNLVGIKPSVGLTSRSLVIPISQHQDTVGPMARTVTDAAYILSIIAGKDCKDNYTLAQPFDSPPDYIRALNFSSLRGARIGIPRNGFLPKESSGPLLDAFESAVEVIKRAGATVIDNANFSSWNEYLADRSSWGVGNYSVVINSDFVSGIADYLSQLDYNPHGIRNLEDVANFTRQFSLEDFPDRNIAAWDTALSLGYNNSDSKFWKAFQYTSFWGGEGGVLGALGAYNLDALIMPAPFAPGLPAIAGLPVVTVPMGFYPSNTVIVKSPRGLVEVGPNIPFGISFLGAKWSEETLIGLAFAYEQRTKIRNKVKPYITPKTQLSDVIRL